MCAKTLDLTTTNGTPYPRTSLSKHKIYCRKRVLYSYSLVRVPYNKRNTHFDATLKYMGERGANNRVPAKF